MGEFSAISWTDHTYNAWIGCTKVSPGCAHCYAERENGRLNWNSSGWGPKASRKRTSDANWKKPLKWNSIPWEECPECGWRGPVDPSGTCPICGEEELQSARPRVFAFSLGDICDDHPSIEESWRESFRNTIENTPNLDWLLLTKRPENFIRYFGLDKWSLGSFPRNIWLGISCENQKTLDGRWPIFQNALRTLRPAQSFLSVEPLIEPVDLNGCLDTTYEYGDSRDIERFPPSIGWVIVGGESGPGARPTHPDWVRNIRDQCQEVGVPLHFKQWGEWSPASWKKVDNSGGGYPYQVLVDGGEYHGLLCWPTDNGTFDTKHRQWNEVPDTAEVMAKVGKKAAGRLLDQRTWDEFPR